MNFTERFNLWDWGFLNWRYIESFQPDRSFSQILLIVRSREQLLGGASSNAHRAVSIASISRFFISLPGNFGELFADSRTTAAMVVVAARRNNYRRRARRLFANYASNGPDQWLPERPLSGRISGVYPSRRTATATAAAAAPSTSRNPDSLTPLALASPGPLRQRWSLQSRDKARLLAFSAAFRANSWTLARFTLRPEASAEESAAAGSA